jgi:hypothetical protein
MAGPISCHRAAPSKHYLILYQAVLVIKSVLRGFAPASGTPIAYISGDSRIRPNLTRIKIEKTAERSVA